MPPRPHRKEKPSNAAKTKCPVQQDGQRKRPKEEKARSRRGENLPAAVHEVSLSEVIALLRKTNSASAFALAEGPLKAHLTALAARHDQAAYDLCEYVYVIASAPESNVRARLLSGLGVSKATRPYLAIFKAIWPGAKGKAGKLLHNRLSSYARALQAAEDRGVGVMDLTRTLRKAGGFTKYARQNSPRCTKNENPNLTERPTKKADSKKVRLVAADESVKPRGGVLSRKAVSRCGIVLTLSNRITCALDERGGWAVAALKINRLNRTVQIVDVKHVKNRPVI